MKIIKCNVIVSVRPVQQKSKQKKNAMRVERDLSYATVLFIKLASPLAVLELWL